MDKKKQIKICHKLDNNTKMSPLPPWYNVVDTFWLSTCPVFPALKLGKGHWEQGTGNCTVYFQEIWDYWLAHMAGTWDILIKLLTLDFVKVLQKLYQFLRHFVYLFLSRIASVNKKLRKEDISIFIFWGLCRIFLKLKQVHL